MPDPWTPPSLTVTLATIRCTHVKRMVNRPCGRCSSGALRDVRDLGEHLIGVAARTLMQLDGHTGTPTPLTYSAAVELLKDLVPAITNVLKSERSI